MSDEDRKGRRPRKMGRPTTEAALRLTSHILKSARELFFEHGFDGASADMIAEQARISKRTLYARFGSKARVFEAAGCGACLITDRWAGIEEFLEPDSEVLVADSGEHVAEIVAGLTPARAHRIAEAARSRILAHHTYAHRARQAHRLFGELTTSVEAAE